MRKKITVNGTNFDFSNFPEEDFSFLQEKIFPKISSTSSALIEHLINIESITLGYESRTFSEKIQLLKKELGVTTHTALAEKLFDKNLKRFGQK